MVYMFDSVEDLSCTELGNKDKQEGVYLHNVILDQLRSCILTKTFPALHEESVPTGAVVGPWGVGTVSRQTTLMGAQGTLVHIFNDIKLSN